MSMRITNPKEVRTLLARRHQWYTIVQIADGLNLHRNTVRSLFKRAAVSPDTIQRVAAAVEKEAVDIAEFVM